MKTQIHVFVAEPYGIEIEVKALSYQEAHEKAWKVLTQEQQDGCEALDWVDNYYIDENGDMIC